MKDIDYEKIHRINEAIKWIWNRIDQIDKAIHETVPSVFAPSEDSVKGLLEERRQLFETYQKNLKELEKCYD